MPQINAQDQALIATLPKRKFSAAVSLVNAWLDDEDNAPFEPIVQAVLGLVGESEPEDEAEQIEFGNRLFAMRTFITSCGRSTFIRNPQGLLANLVRLAKPAKFHAALLVRITDASRFAGTGDD